MAFNFGGITNVAMQWLGTGFFWVVLIFVLAGGLFGFLLLRKKRKLIYSAIELTDLGNGKMGIDTKKKAGWFKSKTFLFGLVEMGGQEVLKMSDGRKILNASSTDFHDINGNRGIVVMRKGDDYETLVPINKLNVSNFKLIAEIAPADYRDASIDIIKSAEKETMGLWEKLLPYIMIVTVALALLVSIILIAQMVQHSQDKIAEMIIKVSENLHLQPSALTGGSTAP